MNVTVNGDTTQLESGTPVSEIVEMTVGDNRGRGIAVAVNGTVVPRGEWATTELRPNDHIEILTAVAGG